MSGTQNIRLIGHELSTDNVILIGRAKPNAVLSLEPRINQSLVGIKDGANHIFTIPNGDKFVKTSYITIQIYWNGRLLTESNDYTIHESGGLGTGYDEIRLTPWQSVGFLPRSASGNRPEDSLIANYWIQL